MAEEYEMDKETPWGFGTSESKKLGGFIDFTKITPPRTLLDEYHHSQKPLLPFKYASPEAEKLDDFHSQDLFSNTDLFSTSAPANHFSFANRELANQDFLSLPNRDLANQDFPYPSNQDLGRLRMESKLNLSCSPTSFSSMETHGGLTQPIPIGDGQLPFKISEMQQNKQYPPSLPQSFPGLQYLPETLSLPNHSNSYFPAAAGNSKNPSFQRAIRHQHHQSLSTSLFPCLSRGCIQIFNSYQHLEAHMQSAHGVINPNNQQSPSSTTAPTLEKSRPYSCPECSQSFSRSHDLKRHSYVHSNQKPYNCMQCGRGFSRLDALKRHIRNVIEGKKVQCQGMYNGR